MDTHLAPTDPAWPILADFLTGSIDLVTLCQRHNLSLQALEEFLSTPPPTARAA